MALASPQITAVCVEANEFMHLSNQFRVRGVPHTVVDVGAGDGADKLKRLTGGLDYPMLIVTTAVADRRAGCLHGKPAKIV